MNRTEIIEAVTALYLLADFLAYEAGYRDGAKRREWEQFVNARRAIGTLEGREVGPDGYSAESELMPCHVVDGFKG